MKEVDQLLDKAEALILAKVKKLARLHLIDENNKTYKFTMAMGTYFFQDFDGEILYQTHCRELDMLIGKYDNVFKITSNPMMFTANGPIITDW